MKREEKNALSRQRILEAALEEFSQKGYEAASLNNIAAKPLPDSDLIIAAYGVVQRLIG